MCELAGLTIASFPSLSASAAAASTMSSPGTPFPTTVEEITPTWIGDILTKNVPGLKEVKVLQFEAESEGKRSGTLR